MINTIEDLQNLVRDGFTDWLSEGLVSVKAYSEFEGLMQFNYLPQCQFKPESEWNTFERMSRGLILNTQGDIVARPFDKFFNWSPERTYGIPTRITKKFDGSLGISFLYKGELFVATRGSLVSEQAQWATKEIHNYREYFELGTTQRWTFLFEIIYPENRIVIDYGDDKKLVLLSARNQTTGNYVDPKFFDEFALSHNLPSAKDYLRTHEITSLEDVLEDVKKDQLEYEGWVVEFDTGERVKIKTARYIYLHKLINSFSFTNFLTVYKQGEVALKEWKVNLPDEFLVQMTAWESMLIDRVGDIVVQVREGCSEFDEVMQACLLANTPIPREVRKDFAMKFKDHPYASYFFKHLVGKFSVDYVIQSLSPDMFTIPIAEMNGDTLT